MPTVTDKPAPNFNGTYPLDGERIGPAWRAAWALLRTRERYTASTELQALMADAGNIAPKTAENLLRISGKRGILDVERRSTTQAGKRRTRCYYRIAAGAR